MIHKHKTSTTKILYHEVKKGLACPDGFFANCIARRALPNAQSIGCIYQTELPQIDAGDKVVIVDFSFPIEVLKTWSDRGCEIILIDHHKTAVDHVHKSAMDQLSMSLITLVKSNVAKTGSDLLRLEISGGLRGVVPTLIFSQLVELVGIDNLRELYRLQSPLVRDFLAKAAIDKTSAITFADYLADRDVADIFKYVSDGILSFDIKKCGAVLTWEYFFPDKLVPPALYYVQDRDLWQWQLPESKAINEAFTHHGRSDKLFQEIIQLSQSELVDKFAGLGNAIVQPKLRRSRELAATAQWRDFCGYRIMVCELNSLNVSYYNDVMEYLYTEFPESPFVATYTPKSEGNGYKFSFRSAQRLDGFDTTQISNQFGGGGHFHASGAVLNALPW